MQVSQGDFGGRHEPEIILLVVIKVVSKLGQITGANHTFTFDHEGRVYFRVAVLFYMKVEHEVNECSLKTSPLAFQHIEPTTG